MRPDRIDVMHLRHGFLLAWLVVALPSPAAQRYEGIAYARGSERLVYRETDWLFSRGGVGQRLVLYRCPDGSAFARKRVSPAPDQVSPDFEFDDGRDGYREGVRTVGGTRQVFVRRASTAILQTRVLPDEADGVVDAGFDAYVRAHWPELSAGTSHRMRFLVPDRFEFLNFQIAGTRDARVGGRPVRELKMSIAAWYGFALPSIVLDYDRAGRHLEQYRGIGTIRDATGHHQDVRIEFPPAARRSGVAEDEIDRAATVPLTGRCSG